MKRVILICLIPFLIFCEKDRSPTKPEFTGTGSIHIIIENEKDAKKNLPDSLSSTRKPASPETINLLEVRVLNSSNSLITSKTFTPSGGYFEGTITVKAQDNLKVLCIGTNDGIVERFGMDENVDVKAGKTTTVTIPSTQWYSSYIPIITSIIPNLSTDGRYTVTWNAVPTVTDYILQEANNQNFSEGHTVYSGTATQKSFTDVNDGTYYYRIMVSNTFDIASGWSDIKSVIVSSSATIYTISGTIAGGGGATVILSGDATDIQIAGNDGSFTFTVEQGGSYTITPTKTDYTISPASQTFSDVNANLIANFTASYSLKTYIISGTVTGADGVLVTLSGDASDSQVVNDGGSYSFTVAENGNYAVTPSKSGYTFTPASPNFNNVMSDINRDFNAVQITYTISGTVSGADVVTVILSGDESESLGINDGGRYSFTVKYGGNYTITPTKSGYTFTPPSATFSDVTSNQTQNFIVDKINVTYIISGTISGADGVTVNLSGDTSDSQLVNDGGSYVFTVNSGGNYTITPSKSGYTFTPSNKSFTNVTYNPTQNFIADKITITYTISGAVTGADSVNVTLSGDASGNQIVNNYKFYSFIVNSGGNYKITPSKSGYTFTPESKTYNNLTSNETMNFYAIKVKLKYSISGVVRGTNDVTITLTKDRMAVSAKLVNDSGSYSFIVDEGGNYKITPSKQGYTFTPESKFFYNITSNQQQDFTASKSEVTYTIQGTVTGADNVTVTLSGDASGSQIVNNGGGFSFKVNSGGDYIVTPTKSGYTFAPESHAFYNITSSHFNIVFTANVITYAISGTVSGADGVTVTLSGDVTDTQSVNDGGTYSFTVEHGGNYTVTPSKSGYTFTPASSTFNNVTSNQTQNFTANVITYTISGTVSGADDVTFSLGGDTSGSQIVNDGGTYSFTVQSGGNYTVTPSKTGYSFTPSSKTFNNVNSNQTQNFTAYVVIHEGKIAFAREIDGDTEIYIMDAGGSNQINITNNYAIDRSPSWSPDGSKIAFASKRDGNFEIYIMDADGSNQRNITNNPDEDSYPSWSPDGSQIAFSSNRDGISEIYIMDIDGTNQINITNNPTIDYYPTWSPDGSKIAFWSRRDGNPEIYVMDADGFNQRNLTNNPDYDAGPSWSPDGSKIAFNSARDGIWQIYVMNSDGSNQIRLTNTTSGNMSPSWSPDGSKITFVSDRDKIASEIYIMDADGTNQMRITNNYVSDDNPSWSPF